MLDQGEEEGVTLADDGLFPSQIIEATPDSTCQVAELLQKGAVAAFPTETVYGLGGLISSPRAIERIFTLKGRPSSNPLIVHLSSLEKVEEVAILSNRSLQDRLTRLLPLTPGPLALVLPARIDRTVSAVRAGGDTVAVRVPNHPVAAALLSAVSAPLAAPSANRSNYISPTRAQHVLTEFPHAGLLILDGGACRIGVESTVLDLCGVNPRILRYGSISRTTLEEILDEVVESPIGQESSGAGQSARSPGLSRTHYAPRTPLFLKEEWVVAPDTSKRIAWVCFSSASANRVRAQEVRVLSSQGSTDEAASRLYGVLRELDELQLDAIVVDEPPREGVGEAIRDRLYRASARISNDKVL